jgi:hypothetical protein
MNIVDAKAKPKTKGTLCPTVVRLLAAVDPLADHKTY